MDAKDAISEPGPARPHPDSASADTHDNGVRPVGAAGRVHSAAGKSGVMRLPSAAASEAMTMLSVIDRAVSAGAGIDAIERMYALYERSAERNARAAYDEAFADMQPHLPEIDKKGKIIIKEKGGEKVIQSTPYALWDDTNRMIKPILAVFGFGLSFRINQTPERLTTTAVLSHRGGHRETTDFSASIDATGSKNNVQGWGSSFSYGKRYTGTAILNITTRGEDDDGKAGGSQVVETISGDQFNELAQLIKETNTDLAKFLEVGNVESLSDIPVTQFARAKELLLAKKKAKAKP